MKSKIHVILYLMTDMDLTNHFDSYRVSQKTWTFFEIGIIPLFIMESFQNFV